MAKPGTATNTSENTMPSEAAAMPLEPGRGVIHVTLGRGRTGKTTWARWAEERADRAGRQVLLADGDRTNSTLSSFYEEGKVRRPIASDEATAEAWLEEVTGEVVENQSKLVLDMGGGDQVFANVATRHNFNSVLPENGVDVVAWYFMSGGRDDHEVMVNMQNRAFAPLRTVIVLNAGLAAVTAAGHDPFAATLNSSVVKTALKAGAKILRMPAAPLATMIAADNLFIGIRAASERGIPKDPDGNSLTDQYKPLNLWRTNELKTWLKAMETAHEDAGVAGWLP